MIPLRNNFFNEKGTLPERSAVVMDDGWRRSYYPIKVSATGGQVCHLGPRFHPSFLWALLMLLLSLFRRRVMNVKQSKGILSPRWRRIDFLQSDDGMSGRLCERDSKAHWNAEVIKWMACVCVCFEYVAAIYFSTRSLAPTAHERWRPATDGGTRNKNLTI
jgi:hypothetical protein